MTFTCIFASISHLRIIFLLELNVNYPFLQRKNFQKITNYPFLINWNCGLPTFCWCHILWCSSCLHPWKKSLLFLGILNRKIKHFMNLLFICKPIKLRPPWDAFRRDNPNQRRHGSTYLTSLLVHIQSFEILLTKCVWSSNFIFISI
jgi:hypothetical protein